MKVRPLVPRLRFPEFTVEWETKKLGDIAKAVIKRNGLSSADIVLTNSAARGIIPQIDFFEKEIAVQGNLMNYYKTGRDDFVYNPRISRLAPVGPFKRNHFGNGVMSPLYNIYRFGEYEVLDYIEQYLNTSHWHKYMKGVANYGARSDRMAISGNDLLGLPLPYPRIDEQEKIAGFLTTVDGRVGAQEKKVELLKKYKKGVMQKIFSQKIRFRDEDGNDYPDWEESRLDDLVSIKTGKKDVNQGNPSGQYPFFTCAREHTYSDEFSFDGDAILIAGNGEVGLCTYYSGKFEAYQRTYVLQDFKLDSKYLFIYLKELFQTFAESEKQQGSMPYIKLSTLQNFPVYIQQKDEQQKIADFLTSIDDKIKVEEAKLSEAKNFKKALLQRMFV